MNTRLLFGGIRLALAASGGYALVARFFWAVGIEHLDVGSYFAYLTIQSNILAVLVTAIAGVTALIRAQDPAWLTLVRAVVLTLTGTSGIIFLIMVVVSASVMHEPMQVPWSDVVLHYVLPVFAAGEWLTAPGRGRSPWRAVPATLVFVTGWLVVTVIRGAIVDWYPYFFLDPTKVASLGIIVAFCSVPLVVFLGLGALVVSATRTDAGELAAAIGALPARAGAIPALLSATPARVHAATTRAVRVVALGGSPSRAAAPNGALGRVVTLATRRAEAFAPPMTAAA
ncbi:Pr6Pr family membrane protein [Galbitalea sp. SE-J8]|uniref:Pr6Pr family membrane protein n=1 Tax=Galbitalea sp. SE-J8 TaxID=3054952 RepID=UPI00259CEE2C|nr:Pr6Pr family membrane protein [Galbitalea sp. SE-J8]MDM4763165.1 Pr6Pr family membrane protein [Galbitalea sp. SE-J8]